MPPSASGLAADFNAQSHAIKAGEKVEPFIMTHEVQDENVQNIANINGAIYQNGKLLNIVNQAPVSLDRKSYDQQSQPGPDQGPPAPGAGPV